MYLMEFGSLLDSCLIEADRNGAGRVHKNGNVSIINGHKRKRKHFCIVVAIDGGVRTGPSQTDIGLGIHSFIHTL